jgi:hypothetical protein
MKRVGKDLKSETNCFQKCVSTELLPVKPLVICIELAHKIESLGEEKRTGT